MWPVQSWTENLISHVMIDWPAGLGRTVSSRDCTAPESKSYEEMFHMIELRGGRI